MSWEFVVVLQPQKNKKSPKITHRFGGRETVNKSSKLHFARLIFETIPVLNVYENTIGGNFKIFFNTLWCKTIYPIVKCSPRPNELRQHPPFECRSY